MDELDNDSMTALMHASSNADDELVRPLLSGVCVCACVSVSLELCPVRVKGHSDIQK